MALASLFYIFLDDLHRFRAIKAAFWKFISHTFILNLFSTFKQYTNFDQFKANKGKFIFVLVSRAVFEDFQRSLTEGSADFRDILSSFLEVSYSYTF